ncbi:TolB-like translocation protein [Actinomadura rudentiformis]|uniref:WD40 repeat domain-containing protein n=1 Tax=Actinomadura rudentiformis TaxID=359158 RepID=A0A6H9YHA7_9ACTN|nr:PD40 domain-containing protein [Actinomadura rudentiformis]KAB2345176.1 hypothetical protein F8566_28320 [Actinomadura rudentiformis]
MTRIWKRVGAAGIAMVLATVMSPAVSAQQRHALAFDLSFDPDKGSKSGSPLDHLPGHIRLLDVDLPGGAKPMRADWSPDGDRLVFLDAPIGGVWEYDLDGGAARNLTAKFLPGGVLRAHHLSNGDLVLCAPPKRNAHDPVSDRFAGRLWVLPRPLGSRAPVQLGAPCWEGVAVSKQPGSTRIAWNESSVDFTADPADIVREALFGRSRILTGRIVYNRAGTPKLVDRKVVLDKTDVSVITPAVEAQDFRRLHDRDRDSDDELIFSAYFHNGGQAMGVDLDTGKVTDYAPGSWFYEEAEGIDPAGRYVLVERDLAFVFFPGELDIWRLVLDGGGKFERVTTFNHYAGYGATNPVVSPDGGSIAFQLERADSEHGQGHGLLLFDLAKWSGRPTP